MRIVIEKLDSGFFAEILEGDTVVAKFATGPTKTALYRKLTSYIFPDQVKKPAKIKEKDLNSISKKRV
jgi:hypothetical protein